MSNKRQARTKRILEALNQIASRALRQRDEARDWHNDVVVNPSEQTLQAAEEFIDKVSP